MSTRENLLSVIGTFGGLMSIITIFSRWTGKVWANKILQNQIKKNDEYLAKKSAELQKEINRSKSQLDTLAHYSLRYSEHQFKVYNELWSELYSLKISADNLWGNVNNTNLKKFVAQLKSTTDKVKKNSLLIEKDHLEELLKLFKDFGDYSLGKKKLIEYKSSGENFYIRDETIRMVEHNKHLKTQYSEILNELETKFRKQLKYYDGHI